MVHMNRLEKIRAEEKAYHDRCYAHNELFAPGSWLQKPVRTVVDLLPRLSHRSSLQMLDLGCGVGRNTIPMAKYIQDQGLTGQIVAVDLLESAIDGLQRYGCHYEVDRYIQPVLSDIESYKIDPLFFDLIIAVSTLEHLHSMEALGHKLKEIAEGTRAGGMVCIIMSSNIREELVSTGEKLDPMFEINLGTEPLIRLLHESFLGWELINQQVKTLQYDIVRQDEPVLLTSDCLTYVARHPDL